MEFGHDNLSFELLRKFSSNFKSTSTIQIFVKSKIPTREYEECLLVFHNLTIFTARHEKLVIHYEVSRPEARGAFCETMLTGILREKVGFQNHLLMVFGINLS